MKRPLASKLRLLFLATTNVEAVGEGVVCIPRYGFQFVNQAALRFEPAQMMLLLSQILWVAFAVLERLRLSGPAFEKGTSGFSQISALTFATTSGSRVYVNPDVDHVTSIRERFSALSPKVVAIEGTTSVKLAPKEAMFVNRMTIEDLVNATCDGKLKVYVVTLKATITAINNHNGWFYISCKSCVRKAVPKDGVYVCTGCGEAVDYPLALFRVNVQVTDDTGSTTVVLFNAVTERMLDVSAKKLINKMPPGDNSVPKELQPLLGKELVFKLKLNKYNSVDGLQDYGVSAVYTPVGELEAAHAKNTLATGGVDLVEPRADDYNVLESDTKRKRKLSSVIEDVSGSGSGAA